MAQQGVSQIYRDDLLAPSDTGSDPIQAAKNDARYEAEEKARTTPATPKAPVPPQGWDQKATTGAATYQSVYEQRKKAGLTK